MRVDGHQPARRGPYVLFGNNRDDVRKRSEEARSLLDFAIDRDQIIILETELLETNGRSQDHLNVIRKQARDNADALRKLLAHY
jgi:hypothetical protein